MAPVKRSTTATQRETRATRAAAVAKKQTTSLEKKAVTSSLANLDLSTAVSTGTVRRGRKAANEKQPDQNTSHQDEDACNDGGDEIQAAKPRATRATVSSIGMAAAPRRRIKVTPLDKSVIDTATIEEVSKPTKPRTKTSSSSSTQRKTTKTKAIDISEPVDEAPVDDEATETVARSTRRTASKPKDGRDNSDKKTGPRTRGRPKAQKVEEEVAEPEKTEPALLTRTTRSKRADAVTPSDAFMPSAEVDGRSKASNVLRKKVTFQDQTEDMDKENQPLPATSKQGTKTNKLGSIVATTGLRAKPLRKAAAATGSTRTRKSATTTRKQGRVAAGDDEKEEKALRVLTPKKITQVAKSSSPEHSTQDVSDGEDELHGGKTPVRDLSVSPRRPQNAALARAMSPAKKLNFGQSLLPKTTDISTSLHESETEPAGLLGSPARRPEPSPFRDTLKDSPKRGLNEGARLLFPHQKEQHTSATGNGLMSSASQPMSAILQSPKRTGMLDPNFFSQSTVKKSVSKSPFKASLLGSLAKRLFSPAKKPLNPPVSKVTATDHEIETVDPASEMEMESEISASSHFRSSSSPLRVLRMEPSTTGLDFDDSILQVRSPLKILKSPPKASLQPNFNVETCIEALPTCADATSVCDVVQAVEPITLEALPDHPSGPNHDEHEGETSLVDAVLEVQKSSLARTASADAKQPEFARRSSVAQVLFRSNRNGSSDESSEDELAADETPMRPQPRNRSIGTGVRTQARISTGVSSSRANTGYGFTPLAAQMSGWLATSPEKSPKQLQSQQTRRQSSEFSPLARQHVDGEVVISRNSTPVQRLSQRKSLQPNSVLRQNESKNRCSDLRKALAQRQSLGASSAFDSPARNPQFDEYMEIRAIEEQADLNDVSNELEVDLNGQDLDEVMFGNEQPSISRDGDDTILADEDDSNNDQSASEAGDLTTDLIKFTHASDTAMIDFCKLAEEANELASEDAEDDIVQTTCVETGGIEASNTPLRDEITSPAESPVLRPVNESLTSPSMLAIDQIEQDSSSTGSPSSVVYSSTESPFAAGLLNTPQPNLGLHERRAIKTVVSKVPLKPEGSVSPIKMPRKRSRSFGATDGSPTKRISFEDLRMQSGHSIGEIIESPNRRIRTSVAPSPGGTSTPATTKSGAVRVDRFSLGGIATPGQMSFIVDDFGDSTLDGIEIPEGYDDDVTELADAQKDQVCTPSTATPRAAPKATPATARRKISQLRTPAKAAEDTPQTVKKTPSRASKDVSTGRTPLGPVGKGVLHGAVVFVDVHTSEGADASGIFVELLSQMGAKCVREWRWNPRASIAPASSNEATEQKVGITHVVYKDGGKRTLEKVRDAKGEVCCVGVAWVLDCERENKWLDESNYVIDARVLPRGGSNRRKSMEPRALLVKNDGSVSTSKARRSVSAEMNELMKRELVNTPARTVQNPSTSPTEFDEEDSEHNIDGEATPTGFVSYDPRTAMTPGTPYLISQGKKLSQMSAPPKQQNRSLFMDDEDEENLVDDTFLDEKSSDHGAVQDAKKFRMKNLKEISKRRKTLGWKPAIGSPLGR